MGLRVTLWSGITRHWGLVRVIVWWRWRRNWRWCVMSEVDICTILPNLGGLLAIPTPTQYIFTLLQVGRDNHFICDAPLGDIFAKARFTRQWFVEFCASFAGSMCFGRSSTAAQSIAFDLRIPGVA